MASTNKQWMQLRNRSCLEYFNGVKSFLEYAFANTEEEDMKIKRPCVDCDNLYRRERTEVQSHLLYKGIKRDYTKWEHHGECDDPIDSSSDEGEVTNEMETDDIQGLLDDLRPHLVGDMGGVNDPEEPNEEAEKFFRLLNEAEKPLYVGCEKHSNLSFLIKMVHIKCLNGWSNNSFTMMLKTIREALPMADFLPKICYGAKKIIKDLGLHYEEIDVCKYDCIIYYGAHKNALSCEICSTRRYRLVYKNRKEKVKKVPWKILRYFPIAKRLQRLFMSSQTAEHMVWHHEQRSKDEVLRHPADSEAWRVLDEASQSFASDPRNVRLGLATDGFNPFGNMNNNHSLWPVLVFPYNLPPWMCMKSPYVFMSLLIPGPKGPGNDIDVFLRPLIDELKMLWDKGIITYDAFKKENFNMKAAILWTINDFPAYACLSGWSTKGKLACPCCAAQTSHLRLEHGNKECYMDHRRYLPADHKWRKQKREFNGKVEKRIAPKRPSGDEVVNELFSLETRSFGKKEKKRKIDGFGKTHNWRKQSVFFELPYWEKLLLRHNLDVMHIEKNVCDSILGTIMNLPGKTKDGLNARFDLKKMKIRHELHHVEENGKTKLPRALYSMTVEEKKAFCQWLSSLKVPDGYSANVSRCVNVEERKVSGMKTHDCHIFLERLLPLAVRELLPKHVSDALIEFSSFFREICSKEFKVDDLSNLEGQIALTLCKLERIFPPAFFDVMIHLSIHLPWEARVAGLVNYRWMYPIERFLKKLKGYVGNKARPEGSIAETYLIDECLTFCSRYLTGVDTVFNRPERNDDQVNPSSPKSHQLSVVSVVGRHLAGNPVMEELESNLFDAAIFYVLENCDELQELSREHKDMLAIRGVRRIEQMHRQQFAKWFTKKIITKYKEHPKSVSRSLLSLARGPDKRVNYHSGYYINGFRFHTKAHEQNRLTQNSGVMVRGENDGGISYYGTLIEVIELRYTEGLRVVLFQCDWYDIARQGIGYKKDHHGITTINKARLLNNHEPFVLASQCIQVYYVPCLKDPNWATVIETKPRNLFQMPDDDDGNDGDDGDEAYQEEIISMTTPRGTQDDEDDGINWCRGGLEDL